MLLPCRTCFLEAISSARFFSASSRILRSISSRFFRSSSWENRIEIHRMLHRVTKERGKESGLKCCGLHWSIDPLKPSTWKLHWSMDESLNGGPSIACPAWPSERVRPPPWPGRRGWRPHLWWNRPATESPRWPPVVSCFFAAKHRKTTTFK